MKNLTTFICICLLLCGCKQESNVPDCNCADLELIGDFGTQEGKIIFHTTQPFPYYTYTIIPKTFFTGGVSSQYQICTDSIFFKQMQQKQIKDSSNVILTGIQGVQADYCNIFTSRTALQPNPRASESQTIIRVKTIDKK